MSVGGTANEERLGACREAPRHVREAGDSKEIAPFPAGPFACIAADPAWHFKARTALKTENFNSRRDVEKHYSTMSIAEICALPVRSIAGRDAHLFLWTTGPNLKNAFDVIDAWGFRYSGIAFTWVKLKHIQCHAASHGGDG